VVNSPTITAVGNSATYPLVQFVGLALSNKFVLLDLSKGRNPHGKLLASWSKAATRLLEALMEVVACNMLDLSLIVMLTIAMEISAMVQVITYLDAHYLFVSNFTRLTGGPTLKAKSQSIFSPFLFTECILFNMDPYGSVPFAINSLAIQLRASLITSHIHTTCRAAQNLTVSHWQNQPAHKYTQGASTMDSRSIAVIGRAGGGGGTRERETFRAGE
jgi:hypothetical protein